MPELEDLIENGGRFRAISGEFLWRANYERILENGSTSRMGLSCMRALSAIQSGPRRRITTSKARRVVRLCDRRSASARAEGALGRAVALADGSQRAAACAHDDGMDTPDIVKLRIDLPIGELVSYASNIPVHETTTLTKFMSLRTFFTGKWADKNALTRSLKIYKQDQAVMEKVRPELLPFDLSAELNVRSDAMGLAYRRRRQELADKGWLLSDWTRSRATRRGARRRSSHRPRAAKTRSWRAPGCIRPGAPAVQSRTAATGK